MIDFGFIVDGVFIDGNLDGLGSGLLKFVFFMCVNIYFIDILVDALFVASAVRLFLFLLKFIDMSVFMIVMLGLMCVGVGVDEVFMVVLFWFLGSLIFLGCSFRARRCSSEIVFGTSTRTLSFFGV